MRVGQMAAEIEMHVRGLTIQTAEVSGVPSILRVLNGPQLTKSIDGLAQFAFLETIIHQLKALPMYKMEANTSIDRSVVGESQRLVNQIAQWCSPIAAALKSAAPPEVPMSIFIRLPQTQTLDELSDIVAIVRRAVDIPAKRVFKGELKFGGFDTGSEWFQFISDNVDTLVLISKFFSAYVSIRGSLLEYRRQSIAIEALAATATATATPTPDQARQASNMLIDILRGKIKDLFRTTAEELYKIISSDADNESINALTIALEDVDNLYERGALFQLGGGAPDEAKTVMPDPIYKELTDIRYEQKRLPPKP